MLSISKFHVSVGNNLILNRLTHDVSAGEVRAVMGANGASKSTKIEAFEGTIA